MHHAKCQYSIVDHFNSILELEHYKDTFRTNYYFFTDKEIEIFEKDTNTIQLKKEWAPFKIKTSVLLKTLLSHKAVKNFFCKIRISLKDLQSE